MLCFQSSLSTLANAPKAVSEVEQDLEKHQHFVSLLFSL